MLGRHLTPDYLHQNKTKWKNKQEKQQIIQCMEAQYNGPQKLERCHYTVVLSSADWFLKFCYREIWS